MTSQHGEPAPLRQAFFFDTGSLASQLSQIKELGASDLPTPHDLDRIQFRRVQGKNALDPHPIRHFTHRERASSTSAAEGNDNSFKRLDTFTIALYEPDLYAHRIASAKLREVLFHLGLLKLN